MPDNDGAVFRRAFLGAVLFRAALGVAAMLLSVAGAALGRQINGDWGPLAGALAGLALGAIIAVAILRALERRATPDRPGDQDPPVSTGREPS